MKKLLIATDGFLPRWDGISSFLNELIPKIKNHFEITVIAPDLGIIDKKFPVKLIRFFTVKLRLADNYYASLANPFITAKIIKSSTMVWVQCLGPIGITSILLAKILKKPVVLYNHMLEWEVFPKSQGSELLMVPINVVTKFFSKLLYNMCNIIIVPSIEHAELLNIQGIRSIKKVVHLGVNVKKYHPAESKQHAKEKIGIDPSNFVVGYGGRVSLEKDLKTLYRAFIRLNKKYPETVLLVAGGGRPEIERLFSNKPNIIITGPQNNLASYYQAMDVYVLPSLVETTSLTTMEAMATEIPVVVTPVGFIKEYINDGVNGLFFPKSNSYALYHHLEHLLNNPNDRLKLGKNARVTIVEQYTWEKTAKGIIDVLDGI